MTETLNFSSVDVARAKQIYQENIRPQLTESDKGKFVTINTATGEYEIDADDATNIVRAVQRFGEGAPMFTLRAGFKAATHLGGGVRNNELENW